MNLKERIEESKKLMTQWKDVPASSPSFNKTLLENQVVIMESLTELKKTILELAIS